MKTIRALIFGLLLTAVNVFGATTFTQLAVVTNSGNNQVTITFTTSGSISSWISYGTGSGSGVTSPDSGGTSHTATLSRLVANTTYNYQAIAADGSKSAVQQFQICDGSGATSNLSPLQGKVNSYYLYGTWAATWTDQSGTGNSPTLCGVPVTTPVNGSLDYLGSMSYTFPDTMKIAPSPSAWSITASDVGNIGPATVVTQVTGASTDISNGFYYASLNQLQYVWYNPTTHTFFPPITGGGVSAVTGTAPITSTGGATPAIGITTTTFALLGRANVFGAFQNSFLASTWIWPACVGGVSSASNNSCLDAGTGAHVWNPNTSSDILIGTGGGIPYPSGSGIPIVVSGTSWGTTVAAPAGTVVGTTDTQTLTNKTLDGVSPATMAFVDPTSSIQTQLNAKQATLTGTGLARNTGASTELSGDATTSGSNAVTVVKVNGGSVPASAIILGTNSSSQAVAAALTSAQLFVGNASNLPASVALTGDSTISNAGLMTNTGVNGATIPVSAAVAGTNGSSQVVAATGHGLIGPVTCTGAGSASAQTCTTTPTFAPATGDMVIFKPGTSNTGALTLNVNSSSAAPVQKWLGTALASGDAPSGKAILATYDGTNWQIATIGNAPTGSGNTTSTAMVNGNLAEASGANSLIDSGIAAGNIGTSQSTAGITFCATITGGHCPTYSNVPSTSGVTGVQGNGAKVQLSTSTTTTNDCVKFDANGNTVDSGAACGTAGVTSVTGTSPVVSSGGATPAISISGVTAEQGNGAKLQLSTGSTVTNDCVKFDANGNTIDSGGACGSASVNVAAITTANYCPDLSVVANTITCATSGTYTAYNAGDTLVVKVANTTTGATTINVNVIGSKTVTDTSGGAITTNLIAGGLYYFRYDGTKFQATGPAGGSTTVDANAIKNATYIATDSGSANAMAGTTTTAFPGAYAAGQTVCIVPANANTGATTIAVNGLSAVNVTKGGTEALIIGDLLTAHSYCMQYDGTEFVLTNLPPEQQLTVGAGVGGNTVTAGTPRWMPLNGTGATASQVINQVPMTGNGTLRFLSMTTTTTQATQTSTITVETCTPSSGTCTGTACGITITIANTAPAGIYSDTTHSCAVSKGDLVDVKITQNVTGSSATFTWGSIDLIRQK